MSDRSRSSSASTTPGAVPRAELLAAIHRRLQRGALSVPGLAAELGLDPPELVGLLDELRRDGSFSLLQVPPYFQLTPLAFAAPGPD